MEELDKAYRTDDGKIFQSKELAESHELQSKLTIIFSAQIFNSKLSDDSIDIVMNGIYRCPGLIRDAMVAYKNRDKNTLDELIMEYWNR